MQHIERAVAKRGHRRAHHAPMTLTLHPGDVALGERGDRLETLLGSCVAIILTDPRRTIGVMCHIVHSTRAVAAESDTGAHAEVAFDTMASLLLSRGIAAAQCEAYVCGGGNMFPELVGGSGHVGTGNVRWALRALEARGIPVLWQDVGGDDYRRLAWTVGDGTPELVGRPADASLRASTGGRRGTAR